MKVLIKNFSSSSSTSYQGTKKRWPLVVRLARYNSLPVSPLFCIYSSRRTRDWCEAPGYSAVLKIQFQGINYSPATQERRANFLLRARALKSPAGKITGRSSLIPPSASSPRRWRKPADLYLNSVETSPALDHGPLSSFIFIDFI